MSRHWLPLGFACLLCISGCRIDYDLRDAGPDALGLDASADADDSPVDDAPLASDAGSDSPMDDAPIDRCGDGTRDPEEECDDGDRDDLDACVRCRLARCGDGFVRRSVEDCDDMNAVDDDGCTTACVVCPAGADTTFISPTDHHCYSWHDVSDSFTEARERCHGVVGGGHSFGWGAHPATFATGADNDDVVAALAPTSPAWIGMHSFAPRSDFEWDDGPLAYSRWGPFEPSAMNVPVVAETSGAWRVVTDTTRFGRLCEHEMGWLIRPTDAHAYAYFGDAVLTWALAEARCVSLGGHLLDVGSAAEQGFLLGLVSQPQETWIGLSDGVTEGDFEWSSGAALTYTFWEPGEPDGAGADDCVVTEAGLGRWHDRSCDEDHDYVCELD